MNVSNLRFLLQGLKESLKKFVDAQITQGRYAA
ncbi:hypothetical protein SAMN05216412_107139 [Nitrosospira multiformis]|uniref:Uncharacterized protein n=1 Tax=Nitrosospira multiformis TaxID=1231 RepID=A0A1I0EY06_9PROT|nr:hypothetical protein SAMN05216412_107139 [Nitrosospira multiformis]